MLIKGFKTILLLFGVFSVSLPTWGIDSAGLTRFLDKHQKNNLDIGVHVISLKTKKEVFSYQKNKLFNPASNMKLLTAATALSRLGVDFRYQTQFFSNAPMTKGHIEHLSIRGSGDPTLDDKTLWKIANQLALRGLTQIKGDLIIDQRLFSGQPYSADFTQTSFAYAAPVTAFAINHNAFDVIIRQTPKGQKPHVFIDPPSDYFRLISRLKLGRKNRNLAITRRFSNGREQVLVKGRVRGRYDMRISRSVSHPSLYAGEVFKKHLKQNGIAFRGRIRAEPTVGSHVIYKHNSPPLWSIVFEMNKDSNNFIAEALTQTLGYHHLKKPGSTEKGVMVLQDYLADLGFSPDDYQIANGSGLSRANRISPRLLTTVLAEVARHPEYFPEFRASLAIAGIDGTVKQRLTSNDVKRRTRVKTGTLKDASTLSGYLPTASGDLFAFAIFVGGPAAGSSNSHRLQEKLILQLTNN